MKELFESRKKEEDEENATQNFYKKFTNQGPAYFGDLDEDDGKLLKYEEAAEQEGMTIVSLFRVFYSSRRTQSGRRRMHTCAKSLTFPPTTQLYLRYRAAQALIHLVSCHWRNLHQSRPTASARPPMRIAPQCQNRTANLSNARNRTHRRCQLPASRR